MTTPGQPPAGPAATFRITMADLLVGAGGLIIFIFSFAPFVSEKSQTIVVLGQKISGGSFHQNAWNAERPLALFIVFAGILLLATAFIDVVWPRQRQIAGVHRHHVQLGLGIYALVQMLGFLALDKGGAGIGWGGVFLFIGSIVAAAGAVLNHLNMLQSTVALPTPKVNPIGTAPAGYVPPQPQTPTDAPANDPQVPPGS